LSISWGDLRMLRFLFILTILLPAVLLADNDDCFACHSDPDLVSESGAKPRSVFIDESIFSTSVHQDMECTDCHTDVDPEDLPHPEKLEPVFCGNCHDNIQYEYEAGIHGMAFNSKQAYAPSCSECHGKHDILSPKNPKSSTFKMNIPLLCGKCHKEGAPVAKVYNISEHNILENYSQSIHGEGLFKKGLIVTATCNDCHRSHLILPHTNPKSSISPRNVAKTCMTCHSRIEDVHVKVIEGEKWEKDPGAIPACTDCHLPHKARKASVALSLSDQACLKCHEKPDVHKLVDGKKVSLVVTRDQLGSSMHREVTCVKCHSDVNPSLHRPCATAGKVDCGSCHTNISEEFAKSGHATHYASGNRSVPTCLTCHDYHETKSHLDQTSKTFRTAVPELCGSCHTAGSKLAEMENLSEQNALVDYSKSIHGRKLEEKGLLPSAICTDCHTAHMPLNHNDPRSSVYAKNVPATCASCHIGIYKDYTKSIHFSVDEKDLAKLPTCTDCHSSHHITEVQQDQFMTEVTNQCGTCHKELAETYLQTMHGKAYQLGYLQSAKCSDCHGAHLILPVSDPQSSVGLKNIVQTCQKCHDDANKRFTGYLTHATHHDRDKYPAMFYTYWAMTSLLVGVFSFFGIHTLLWLPRSIRNLRNRKKYHQSHKTKYYIKRFDISQRVTHLFVIISFISLALTGMMLKFSGTAWAGFIADMIGGVRVAGVIHRIAAVITFGYFFSHIYLMIKQKRARKVSLIKFIFGPNSMMFNLKDLKDFAGTLRWFIGKGERPDYGRWTYWEKFDYFAVFWGVAVIGFSGLMLWFPEFFTNFLPGWLINVATIIHSDEALLAVGFIFTIHFFNTHLRPEAFPMDKVIFTGLVPLDEYKKDRPHEYEELKKSGELRKKVVKDYISPKREKFIKIMGFTFLFMGLILVIMIILSVLFGYH
jgi:predicted CXXCH cytochrome family protein